MGKIKNSKIFFLIAFVLINSSLIYASTFQDLIRDKKWDKIGSIFSDSSYMELKEKFSDYSKVHFVSIREGKIKYYLKKKR